MTATAKEQDNQTAFDVYARPFIPHSLKAVNEAPASIIQCAQVRWIDFEAYVHSFAGMRFINEQSRRWSNLLQTAELGEKAVPVSHPLEQLQNSPSGPNSLAPYNYRDFLTAALRDEHRGMQMLTVPGLREANLRIELGDVVELRQLRFDQAGNVVVGSLLKHRDGRTVKSPMHRDVQHNAVIWGIDRLDEMLTLRIDSLVPRSMLFNAKFTVQQGRIGAMLKAAIIVQGLLSTRINGWMRSMIFPTSSDGQLQRSLNKAQTEVKVYDALMNHEQRRAVETILHRSYGSIPYVISGPPGTGKTKTIVELALQLLLKDEASHLIMCAPSDTAADTLVQRLSNQLRPTQLLRLNAPSRSFPEVPSNVLSYCCIDDGMFSLPAFDQLMQVKIVVTTCRDADILLQAHISNTALYDLERTTYLSIHPTKKYQPITLHWTGLLIDEAAQATELEALIPLLVVAPPDEQQLTDGKLPIFVMVGDQSQLGPRTASKTTSLRMSLFERILARPIYSEHPLARSKQSGGIVRPLTQKMLPILRPAFTNLIRNYRSHPSILAIPSHLFYNDTLEPEAANTQSLQSFADWRGRKWPVLFLSHNDPDEIERDGGGWYNINEAKIACRQAKAFLDSGLIRPEDICIMSPFRAQVRILRKIARETPFFMSAVNIGPLEAFQGLESRLVILCTTRTRNRFIEQDLAKGLGVIHEPQRLNVALTRAKHGLVVIGNPEVLVQDRNWCAFMAFCLRNGLWKQTRTGQWTQLTDAITSVPRLEKQLLQSEAQEHLESGLRSLGLTNDDEAAFWRSGTDAEEHVLQEDSETANHFSAEGYD